MEQLSMRGRLIVSERRGDGDWDHVLHLDNVIVNGWYLDLFGVLTGTSSPTLVPNVIALGTGTLLQAGSPPAPTVARSDIAMVTEWKRYGVASSQIVTADPPATTLSFFLPSSDGAVTLTEAGLFYGGSLTLRSGQMMSHAPFPYSKSALTDARIDYQLSRSS